MKTLYLRIRCIVKRFAEDLKRAGNIDFIII